MDQYSREFIAKKARLRLDRFYRATRELGRVFKTEFILDYLSQPALRTRIRRGLLKGEQLHALARCVHYGRLGRLDQRSGRVALGRVAKRMINGYTSRLSRS